MNIASKNIISSTDITKSYKDCREKAKRNGKTIIFKNNKPDMVLMDFDKYEELNAIIEEVEHMEIYELIQERNKNDNGKRYSLSEVKDILKRNKETDKKARKIE